MSGACRNCFPLFSARSPVKPNTTEGKTMSDSLASSLSPELRTRVRDIVAEVLEVSADEVDENKSFAEDFDADSLLVIEIFSRFERQLSLKIPQEELTDLDDLGAAYALIARHSTDPEALRA